MDKINGRDVFSASSFALGFQHLLTMYAGAVVVPIIVGNALNFSSSQVTFFIALNIFVSAIATLISVIRGKFLGVGLPIVIASSATAIGPMIQVGSQYGLEALFGAIFVSGIIMLVLSPIFARLLDLFPALVTNTMVILIGITLIPVAINYLAGGEGRSDYGDPVHLAVGFMTFLSILFLYRWTRGFVQSISVLIGLVIGLMIASFFGLVDYSAIQEASWFQLPMPFHLATFEFNLSAIISILVVGMVSMIEATGMTTALGGMTDRELTSEDYKRTYISLSVSYLLAGFFNAAPVTSFSQNVGVINMSGVKKREVIMTLVFLMFLTAFVPKIGGLAAAIPSAVLGGAMIFLFGNILSYGISELGKLDMDMSDQIIVGVSLSLGLGVTIFPEAFAQLPHSLSWLTSSGIVTGTVSLVLLNLFFNGREKKKA